MYDQDVSQCLTRADELVDVAAGGGVPASCPLPPHHLHHPDQAVLLYRAERLFRPPEAWNLLPLRGSDPPPGPLHLDVVARGPELVEVSAGDRLYVARERGGENLTLQ